MNGFDAYKKHINPVLAELEDLAGISRRFVRAEGCNLWDEAGNCYPDFDKYDVAAVVLEPIQVEAGIQLPQPGYLSGVKELCRKHDAYMVLDEISTGLGRTGPLFAFQHDDIVPDIITVAKSLGGGLLPMGAYLTTRDIFQRAYGSYEMCAAHHSTFGGNSLSCLTALKTLELLTGPDFSEKVAEKGNYLLESLRKRLGPYSIVREVRGKGLLLGLEFLPSNHPWISWENMELSEFMGHNAVPMLVMRHLLKNRIITQICGHNWNVLKIEPPLVVEKNDIDRFVDAIDEAVEWIGSII